MVARAYGGEWKIPRPGRTVLFSGEELITKVNSVVRELAIEIAIDGLD